MNTSIASVVRPTLLSAVTGPWRRPLDVWSREIFDVFRDLQRSAVDTEPTITAIAECFNQAALVELYLGRADAARLLCDAHLHWHHAQWLVDRLECRIKLAVQPWVNHLRLDAMTGRGREARMELRTLGNLQTGFFIDIGPFRISGDVWQGLLADGTFRAFVSTVRLWDSARSIVRDGCWSEAHGFAADNAPGLRFESDPPVLEELTLLADLNQGRPAQALSAASRMCDEEPNHASLFKYYCARALAQQGFSRPAVACAKEATDLAVARLRTGGPTPSDVEVLRELAQLSESLDDQALAYEAGVAVHGVAVDVQDDVTLVRVSALLARTAPGELREHWEGRHAAARGRSLYACFAAGAPRRSGTEALDVPHGGSLCAALAGYARGAGDR